MQGNHIKRTLQTDTSQRYEQEIHSAERHCKRAICDAISATIDSINMELYDVQSLTNYRFVSISDYVSNHITYSVK